MDEKIAEEVVIWTHPIFPISKQRPTVLSVKKIKTRNLMFVVVEDSRCSKKSIFGVFYVSANSLVVVLKRRGFLRNLVFSGS